MKKTVLVLMAFGLMPVGGFSQSNKMSRGFTGEIMDSACAKQGSHAMMEKEHKMPDDAKACTLACVKAGAQYVLYDPATKKTYALDDQKKPESFAGQKVRVNGNLDSATNTIHVFAITPAS
jgi:hypothetical protein